MVFVTIFLLEIVIKIIGLGYRFFLDSWNLFDLAVIAFSTVGVFIA